MSEPEKAEKAEKKIKLFNKGLRRIHCKEGIIMPNKMVSIGETEGKRLMALYGDELIDSESAAAPFKADADSAVEVKENDTEEAAKKAAAKLEGKKKRLEQLMAKDNLSDKEKAEMEKLDGELNPKAPAQ